MSLRPLKLCFIFCILALLCPALSSGEQKLPVYNIGTVTDGTTATDHAMLTLFKKELQMLAEGEFVLNFPKSMALSGKDTKEGAITALNKLFSNPDTDLLLTVGGIGSSVVFKWDTIPKPVVAPLVLDSVSQGALDKDGSSGIHNLTFMDSMFNMDMEVINFRKIVLFDNLAILIDQRDLKALPEITKYAKRLANEHTITVTLIPVTTSPEQSIAAIPAATEAVMVGSLYSFSSADHKKLSQGLIDRHLPSYAIWSYSQVENGLLATNVPREIAANLARRSAVAAQDILLGEDASTLTANFSRGRELTINMATARSLDIYPGLAIMTGANLLNEARTDIQRRLTLHGTVQDALKENLDLSSSKLDVAAGKYSVSEARSPLLPQIGIGTGYRVIDNDRATLSFGSTPEKAWTGTASASQQIYSERSWSAYTVEKHNQESRVMNYETARLEVIYQTAVAYINVLRAKTIEQLVKNNLKLTQAYLDRARIRVSTGVAGPDEIYRWETKFSTDKIDVLKKESTSLDSMTVVNRILNRPIQELFVVEETDLNDPLNALGNKLFYQLTKNPKDLLSFQNFAVTEALANRPELKAFDAAIEAKRRIRTAAGREIWLPDFTLEGSVDQYFNESGSGQRGQIEDGLDDTDWQVGVFASLPLFEGGRKSAALGRAREELRRLQIDRQATANQINQETLISLNQTRASYPGISLSRDAADSARRNLDLITDSYAHGIKSIIELLDAQNQALIADQAAANSVYNFLIDLMGVQRSMGEFISFQPPEQTEIWSERVKQYLDNPPEASAPLN